MKYLVYLSARGVRVIQHDSRRDVVVGEADAGGANGLLAQIPVGTKTHIVVDSVDDEYRNLVLPHVIGFARREMLKRHRQTVLVNQVYTAVSWQARLKTERCDDLYLFAAIPASDWLCVYLQGLQHTQIVVMTSVAILVQQLACEVDKQATALWVTQDLAGVRLSFIKDGRLSFTRLLNHDLDVAQEIGKTQQYLISHQLLASSATLCVHHTFALQITDLPQLQWVQHTNNYLAVVGRYSRVLNFASSDMLQAYQRARKHRWLVAITVFVTILGVGVAGYLYQQNQQLLRRWQVLSFTQLPVVTALDITDQKAVVTLAQHIHSAPEPVMDLVWLSKLLIRYPQLQVKHLLWSLDSEAVLILEGLVSAGSSDIEMREVDVFVAELRHDPHVTSVKAQHVPIDTDPNGVMHGGLVQDTATFVLQVNLRGAV
jgi:hypothetical protein